MKALTMVLLLAVVALPAAAQTVPPQSHLEIWVTEDGTQGFLLRIAFPDTSTDAAEVTARNALPRMLAEKQWCLRGWSIDKKESVPVDRPRGAIVTFTGTCKQ